MNPPPTSSLLFVPVFQVLAEECWYMFLRYNHAHYERRYVMHLVIHYQFIQGSARQLCGLLQNENNNNQSMIQEPLPEFLQQRLKFYRDGPPNNPTTLCHLPYQQALMRVTNDLLHSATTHHSHEALVKTLQDASRIEFIPATATEALIHKVMLEAVTTEE